MIQMPMRERPDLLSEDSPEGLQVFQLTTEETPSSHIYMEAQIFTPDSRRFLLHHPARAHGIDFMDPARRYLICDLDAGGGLTPITEEVGAAAPSVSPDGEHLYYFVDGTSPGAGGRLTLKRVRMDGTGREEIAGLDGVPSGWPGPFSRPYSLSTISSGGDRLAISGFLGDGSSEDAPWGLLVFDVATGGVELILQGPSWCNVHAQIRRPPATSSCRRITATAATPRAGARGWWGATAPTCTSSATTAPISATCRGGATATSSARVTSAGSAAASAPSPAP